VRLKLDRDEQKVHSNQPRNRWFAPTRSRTVPSTLPCAWSVPCRASKLITLALAYTAGFERGEVVVDDGTRRPMVIRATQIYRRFGDDGKLVHRDADFPPEDQRHTTR